MSWTAAQIVQQACLDAHVPGFVSQGQLKLQMILDDLCHTGDYASARGVYYFHLNPSLITTFGGFANFSGPYALPLDYLRTSGSSGAEGVQWSFFYVFSGMPYQLVPWDLGKMDQQPQFPSSQTFPWAYATDIATETTAQDRLAGTSMAQTSEGSNTITVTDATNMLVGMGVAGLGIAPGSVIMNFGGTGGGVLGSGGGVLGTGAGSMLGTGPGGTTAVNLSLPAVGTFNNASIMFGTQPVAYIYPGPSGAYPVTLRYQRLMPPLIDFNRIPWFPHQGYLLHKLTAEMMATADDARRMEFHATADRQLGQFEAFSDDKTSRAQTVVMDGNNFRSQRSRRLPITKSIGW